METSIKEFSGRKFSEEDIELIKSIIKTYSKLAQQELASTVCELIGWTQPNGNPKETQCIRYLQKLDDAGIINLPPKRKKAKNRETAIKETEETQVIDEIGKTEITKCEEIKLEIMKSSQELQQWRSYISKYHYLGYKSVYGSQIRYMIKSNTGQDLGCLLFSASSWALAPRDEYIGWTIEEKKERLNLVVNNSRFLVMPGVCIKNLASRALSMAARRIQDDWLERYCYAPVLIETFVDVSKYKGIAYKASNYIYLGETQGRGRNDRYNEYSVTRKAIYIYPLQKDYIKVLRGEKPCKVVDPDGI